LTVWWWHGRLLHMPQQKIRCQETFAPTPPPPGVWPAACGRPDQIAMQPVAWPEPSNTCSEEQRTAVLHHVLMRCQCVSSCTLCRYVWRSLVFRGRPRVLDLTTERRVAGGVAESSVTCSEEQRDAVLYYVLARHPGRTLVFVNAGAGPACMCSTQKRNVLRGSWRAVPVARSSLSTQARCVRASAHKAHAPCLELTQLNPDCKAECNIVAPRLLHCDLLCSLNCSLSCKPSA
jgi:hypothetical protein